MTYYSALHYAAKAEKSAIAAAEAAELAKQYGNGKINQTHITNCITEIPQDIKLELNNGTLTLKAGSRVYVPNGKNADGSNKFDEVVIAYDNSLTQWWGESQTFLLFYDTKGSRLRIYDTGRCYSGTTSVSDGAYYNTNDNKLYVYDGGSLNFPASLPIAIIAGQSPTITSIDQVFNGFGYIGSTAFALPGVKGLIPNGRNADGSLKNIELTVDKVVTRTITWNNVAGQSLFIGKYNLNEDIKFISSGHTNTYFQQEDEPSLSSSYAMWYKPSENKIYRVETVSEGEEIVWKENFSCYIGQWFSSAVSPYPITELTTKLPFRAVDYNDLDEKITGQKTVETTNEKPFNLVAKDIDTSYIPLTDVTQGVVSIQDVLGNIMGYIFAHNRSNGQQQVGFQAKRTVDGTDVYSTFATGINGEGQVYTLFGQKSGTTYIKIPSGEPGKHLLIKFGAGMVASGDTINYSIAFSSAPQVIAIHAGTDSSASVSVNTIGTTSFRAYHQKGSTKIDIRYIAIGWAE